MILFTSGPVPLAMHHVVIPSPLLRYCTAATLCLLAGLCVRAEVPILPYDQVKAGMRGVGKTVFSGSQVEEFEVEILGKLPNIGVDQDLILGLCTGGPLEHTGIMSGMSGSPVYVDGKLIGAVAYSWGFSKDPIAGITPIESMLDIPGQGSGPSERASSWEPRALEALRNHEQWNGFFVRQWNQLQGSAPGLRPVAIPLGIAGMDAAAVAAAMRGSDARWLPMQSGGGAGVDGETPRLEPGSPIGVKLIRGDVEMSATGTITWIDDRSLLAFGHPLFGLGSVDLLATAAQVEALMPSLVNSAKMAVPTQAIGALREDRTHGVAARRGVEPSLIPARLQLRSPRGERSYSFDLADDPVLTPVLLYMALNGIVANRERGVGHATVQLAEGSVIKLGDGTDIPVDNLYAGANGIQYGTSFAPYVMYLLMNNPWTPPRVAGINLIVEYDDAPRTARIAGVSLDRYRAKPGDSIQATIRLAPYGGAERTVQRSLEIPANARPGGMTLTVGGAAAINRTERRNRARTPTNLDHLIRAIRQLRRNDRIYLAASQADSGGLIGAWSLPDLPPTARSVVALPRNRSTFLPVATRSVVEDSLPTDYQIEGGAALQLEIEER